MNAPLLIRGAIGLAAAAVIWQLVALSPLGSDAFPTFTTTLASLVTVLASPEFWNALGTTVGLALAGLVSAGVAGVIVGLLVGTSPAARAATLAVFEFLKPIPPIVILPLLVLVLGPTASMTWALIFFGCVLAIVMQTVDGVNDTDPVTRDTARSYGMGRAEILWHVVLPSAAPFIGTAMRVAAPVSLIIAVVGGLLGGGPGLGQSLLTAQTSGDYPTLYALVLVLGVLGLIFVGASTAIERRILHWHPSYREAAV
ncbi:ABC transporter permease subunit [Micrococcales bacterium 31B]|nr:ABC transporter permease subunit [Micrococcales bacterium 31B]